MRRSMVWFGALTLVMAAACGSGGASPAATSPATTPAASATATPAAPMPAPTTASTAAPSTGGGIGGPGDFEPGAVRFRVANVSSAPVDVYVRTQGVVEAYRMTEGLAPGTVTDYLAPPDPGTLVVTRAGAGDPACVASCPHFIGTWSTTSGVSNQQTVIIGDAGGTDLWEHPRAEDIGRFANALPDGDPAVATFFVAAGAVTGADFGLRLAFAGVAGCQADSGASGLLIGGTSILSFAHDGTAKVTIHDNTDRECTSPVGGPFDVAAAKGTRTLVILFGAPGALEALVLPIA